MARKTKRPTQSPAASTAAEGAPPRSGSDRDKAIAAFMELLAEHPFHDIGLAEVAGRAA